MSRAHQLLESLGFQIQKGQSTRYPATSQMAAPGYRFWATEMKDAIQFGAQAIDQVSFDKQAASQLMHFNFKLRPNGREAFVRLPLEIPEAVQLAQIAAAALAVALNRRQSE